MKTIVPIKPTLLPFVIMIHFHTPHRSQHTILGDFNFNTSMNAIPTSFVSYCFLYSQPILSHSIISTINAQVTYTRKVFTQFLSSLYVTTTFNEVGIPKQTNVGRHGVYT